MTLYPNLIRMELDPKNLLYICRRPFCFNENPGWRSVHVGTFIFWSNQLFKLLAKVTWRCPQFRRWTNLPHPHLLPHLPDKKEKQKTEMKLVKDQRNVSTEPMKLNTNAGEMKIIRTRCQHSTVSNQCLMEEMPSKPTCTQ